MGLTFYTVVESFIYFNLGVGFICFFVGKKLRIGYLGINAVLTVVLIFAIKIFLPVEFSFTRIVSSKKIYPLFMDVFTKTYVFQRVSILMLIAAVVTSVGIFLFIKSLRVYLTYRGSIELQRRKPSRKAKRIYGKVADELKIKNPPVLFRSGRVLSPCQAGFFNPVIVLPNGNFSEMELYYILRHEAYHYKNKDTWIKLLCVFTASMLWWNPIVYLMKREMTKLLEMRCDDRVCRDLNFEQVLEYTESVVKVLKNMEKLKLGFDSNYFSSDMAKEKNSDKAVKERFKIIFGENAPKHRKFVSRVFVGAVTALTLFSYTFVVQPFYYPPAGFDEGTKALSVKFEAGQYVMYADDEYSGPVDNDMLRCLRQQGNVKFYD